MSRPTVQIMFARPAAMHVQWDIGRATFNADPLVVPARQNFPQGGIFQLKISHVEGLEGVELYPTLEVGPITPRTEAYLAHNALPIQFTQEDLEQVVREQVNEIRRLREQVDFLMRELYHTQNATNAAIRHLIAQIQQRRNG